MIRGRCPKCANKGQDTSGDNLAIYPDGHKHCYACGYHEGLPVEERLKQTLYGVPIVPHVDQTLDFPKDYNTFIPTKGTIWLKRYGITDKEIEKHRFGWSEEQQMLIFPVLDGDGSLIMWQGKNFNPTRNIKYFTKGAASDVLHFVGQSSDANTIILTEDLLSAIKVGRLFQAMPLWGSHIPLKLLRRLSERFKSMGVWLDRDKTNEALRAVLRASQYLPSYLIVSVFDPKEYETHAIREIVEAAMLDKTNNNEEPYSMIISEACRRLEYSEAAYRYPQQIRNLTDYVKYRNAFDNVKEHEITGPSK